MLIPFRAYDGGVATSLNDLVGANLATHPVYVVGQQVEKKFGAPFSRVHYGLVDRLERKGSVPDPYAVTRAECVALRAASLPGEELPGDELGGGDREELRRGGAQRGLRDRGRRRGAGAGGREDVPRRRSCSTPTEAVAYKNLGLLLYQHGGDASEIVSLWTGTSSSIRRSQTSDGSGPRSHG